MVLGVSLGVRSQDTPSLERDVAALWGTPIDQNPPTAAFENDKGEAETLPLAASDVNVKLDLEPHEKDLQWFSTYVAGLHGRYTFDNPANSVRYVGFSLPLRDDGASYKDLEVTDAHGRSMRAWVSGGMVHWAATLRPHEQRQFDVAYRTHGIGSFRYEPSPGTGQVKNFHLAIEGNFDNVGFLPGSISPTAHHVSHGRWHGEWHFKTLVASAPIGIELPKRVDPGPFAMRISFFAPVGLLFFFVVVATERKLRPDDLWFLGCSFFSFFLLFAFLINHLPLAPSFAIASIVSIGLSVNYGRRYTSFRVALREIGLPQFSYLVPFSLAFLWPAFTGLAVTIGAIVTLFVVMKLARRRQHLDEDAGRCPHPYRCAAKPAA